MNKIRYYIEMFKTLKADNVKTVVNDLERIKKEFDQIYFEAVEDKEISDYRLYLLKRKTTLLTDLASSKIIEYTNFTTDLKKVAKLFAVVSVISLLALAGIFFATGINFLLVVYIFLKLFDLKMIPVKRSINETRDYVKDMSIEMKNTQNNCVTFLTKKIERNSLKKVDAIDNPDIKYELNAVDFITEVLEKGRIPLMDNLDPKTMDIVIKMLQHELHSNEADLKELLNLAINDISQENLLSGVYRVREKKE